MTVWLILLAIVLALVAGLAIPLGAFLASIEHIQPDWLEQEFRHSVFAFGGGILLAAVSLVLIPEAQKELNPLLLSLSFLLGALLFFMIDYWVEKKGSSLSQIMATMLDFLPEAIAMGSMLTYNWELGVLMCLLIGLQNLPEGFNALREIKNVKEGAQNASIISHFVLLALLGPVATVIGMTFFTQHLALLAALMSFCSGGILYLIFQDIAPQAKLNNAWAPPLGANFGFLTGLISYMLV